MKLAPIDPTRPPATGAATTDEVDLPAVETAVVCFYVAVPSFAIERLSAVID